MELRDFVGVKKRAQNERTLDFVKKKSLDTKLHVHDLDDAKTLETVIKPVIHAAVDEPSVMASTPKENPHWYDYALKALPAIGTIAGGVIGSRFGAPGIGATLGNVLGGGGEFLSETAISSVKGGGSAYNDNPAFGSSMFGGVSRMTM